jgi:FkbM family methyltransferase
MPQAARTLRGIARSLRLYYGDRRRRREMALLYGHFVKPGDLVFDIGAHVGDRIAAFRHLGARVVAVEPQPALARTLRLFYGRDAAVIIEPLAVSRSPGLLDFRVNLDNPTVSTASEAFLRAADGAPGWQGQTWSRTIRVAATTLDALIERHGVPAFIKIDVEGLEADVLAGLSHRVGALSFEFTTILPHVALECVGRCASLGYARYNAILGETHSLIHPRWIDSEEIACWLSSLPVTVNSGDVYALQESGIRNQESVIRRTVGSIHIAY